MSFDVLTDLNYLAVLVAAVAYFAIGAVWYTALFGKAWMTAAGVTEEQARTPRPMVFVGTFMAYLLAALTLAAIARSTGATSLGHGIVLGLFVGVGVVAAMMWVGDAYERRPANLFLINGGNALLGFLVMSVIVTIWD